MRIGKAKEMFKESVRKDRRVCLVGPPGVGKTVAKMEACAEEDWDYLGVCTPLEDPSTIRGYPMRDSNGKAKHVLFDVMDKAFSATKMTVLDFDEMGGASESTLKSVLRLFQFGELDGKKLPPCVRLSSSTNAGGHGAGVQAILSPMKSRFHSIWEIETCVDDVVPYGLARGWPVSLLSYLRNSPTSLLDFKPMKNMKPDGACPRTWEYTAEWINLNVEDVEVIAGCVGLGQATAFLKWHQMCQSLPDIAQIIMNPATAAIPEDPDVQYVIATALAANMTANNFGQVLTYLKRMKPLFKAFAIRDAFRAEEEKQTAKKLPVGYRMLNTSRDYTAWVVSKEGQEIIGTAALANAKVK
jgi:hypothetical protein